MYPKLPLLVRAKNTEHKKRLEKMFGKPHVRTLLLVFIDFSLFSSLSVFTSDDIYVMSPVLAEDSVLLTLPFGGAVLQSLGVSKPEVDAILEDFRKILMDEDKNFSDDTFDFLNSFKKKSSLSSSKTTEIGNSSATAAGSADGDSNEWEYGRGEKSQNEITDVEVGNDEREMLMIKDMTEEEIPDYLDGSDLPNIPSIDYLVADN